MSDYETIRYDKSAAVLTLTLNRPDRCNAFTETMHRELGDALTQAGKDDGVRAVILTGAGKAFCSGQDMNDLYQGESRNLGDSLRRDTNPNILRLRNLEKPVIAAINGAAAGTGMSLALACDLRIAAAAASLAAVLVDMALVPDAGSTWFLPRLVGYHRAFELCSSGRKVDAAEALKLNLVDAVVPDGDLIARANSIAEKYAAAPAKTIGLLKRALNRAAGLPLEDALEWDA